MAANIAQIQTVLDFVVNTNLIFGFGIIRSHIISHVCFKSSTIFSHGTYYAIKVMLRISQLSDLCYWSVKFFLLDPVTLVIF